MSSWDWRPVILAGSGRIINLAYMESIVRDSDYQLLVTMVSGTRHVVWFDTKEEADQAMKQWEEPR